MNMNAVRKKVLENLKPYLEFCFHNDLIAFTVGSEYFSYDGDACEELDADFGEVVVVVEKKWLFESMVKDGIANPLEYLQTEYTWDDSYIWFENAKMAGKVAVIEFN